MQQSDDYDRSQPHTNQYDDPQQWTNQYHSHQNDDPHLRAQTFHVPAQQMNRGEHQNMSDVVRFMARRELVATGLLQLDERPENYRAWKASFINATRDLNLTANENMDLLVKCMGTS